MKEEIEEALKEQVWVVGEDGKAILEYILKKLDVLEELYNNLFKSLELLDEKMDLQQEINDLQKKIEELEDEDDEPGEGVALPPAAVCTPSREAVYTRRYDQWQDVDRWQNGTNSTVSWEITYGQ